MSSFDTKKLSHQDAFRLEQAQREEAAGTIQSDGTPVAPPAFDAKHSPVAKVVEQIMSHWADSDEGWAEELAEQSGDPNLKRVVGEKQGADARQPEGMTGDFHPDAAGPAEGIEIPPKADGGEFGGGGGGGTGDAADLAAPWLGDDEGGMADPGDMPDLGMDLPGFSDETGAEPGHGGGGGGGGSGKGGNPDGDDPLGPPKPPDPKKPKKP